MRSEKLAEAEREYEEVAGIPMHFSCYFLESSSFMLTLSFVLQLKADGAEATRKFERIVKLMNEEIIRFQEQKTLDLGVAFHEFAKGQAELAKGISEAWQSLLPKLESCSS